MSEDNKEKDGVSLFCEWTENGVYHNGYQYFTKEEFERINEKTEETEEKNRFVKPLS